MQQIYGFQSLSQQDMISINGGEGSNMIRDFFYLIGATARCTWEFCKTASEFQASLPANLKK